MACPALGWAFAPAIFFDPVPSGAFTPAKFFDPAPGGAFARQSFLTRPRGALAGAYPGLRNSLLRLMIRGFLDSVDYFVACSCLIKLLAQTLEYICFYISKKLHTNPFGLVKKFFRGEGPAGDGVKKNLPGQRHRRGRGRPRRPQQNLNVNKGS